MRNFGYMVDIHPDHVLSKTVFMPLMVMSLLPAVQGRRYVTGINKDDPGLDVGISLNTEPDSILPEASPGHSERLEAFNITPPFSDAVISASSIRNVTRHEDKASFAALAVDEVTTVNTRASSAQLTTDNATTAVAAGDDTTAQEEEPEMIPGKGGRLPYHTDVDQLPCCQGSSVDITVSESLVPTCGYMKPKENADPPNAAEIEDCAQYYTFIVHPWDDFYEYRQCSGEKKVVQKEIFDHWNRESKGTKDVAQCDLKGAQCKECTTTTTTASSV